MGQGGTVDIEKACVYTCLFGGYEVLTEQPAAATAAVPFICITDDPELTSDTWEVRVVESVLPRDAPRSSRHPKCFPAQYLDAVDVSLYIDNSVLLRRPPDALLDVALSDPATGLAVSTHSFHSSLREEAGAVIELGLEDPARVTEIVEVIGELAPELLERPPYWGGLVVRRHDAPGLDDAMTDWWWQILRYSRRDQLSLPLILARHPELVVFDLGLDNHHSDDHEWPVAPRPGREAYVASASGGATRKSAAEAFSELRRENERLSGLLTELTGSSSWRLTGPLRTARAALGRRKRTDGNCLIARLLGRVWEPLRGRRS